MIHRYIPIFVAALLMVLNVTAPVTAVWDPENLERYWNPPDVLHAIPRAWHPVVTADIKGKPVTFTRTIGFNDEDDCLAYLKTDAWKVERHTIAIQILGEDQDADPAGEVTCVEKIVPPRRA